MIYFNKILFTAFFFSTTAHNSSISFAKDIQPSMANGECQRDYSNIDFCEKNRIDQIKSAINEKSNDFNLNYFILGMSESPDRTSYVAVRKKDGKIYPLPFEYFGGYVNENGFPDKARKPIVKFSINNNEICFSGSVYEYRNTITNATTCYLFIKDNFEMTPP